MEEEEIEEVEIEEVMVEEDEEASSLDEGDLSGLEGGLQCLDHRCSHPPSYSTGRQLRTYFHTQN